MSAQDFSALISARRKELKLSVAEFSRRSGLARQSLYRLLDAEVEQAHVSTFIKLGIALQLHPMELMRVFFKGWQFPVDATPPADKVVEYDDVGFIADVTYPDHSVVSSGQQFEKIWEIQNVGNVVWKNRRIVCVDEQIEVKFQGEVFQYGLKALEGNAIDVPLTQPGEFVRVSRMFEAPTVACSTISWWKMVDEQGELVFPDMTGLYCLVRVVTL